MITRVIYPLGLRAKISWKLRKLFPKLRDKNISLEFSKKLRFDLSRIDFGHISIILNGFYELDLTRSIIKLGANGGLLVDVGANYGYFSCLWASQNPQNSVIAFEASPFNVEPLKNNIDKNMLQAAISVVPIAMGKEKGRVKFDLGSTSNQTGWGGFTLDNHNNIVEVDVDTLDNYAIKNQIDKIDVLKIDTEGADTWVLFGAERLLKEKRIENIFFERNMARMRPLNITPSEAVDFLKNLDYTVEQKSSTDFYAYPKTRYSS